jgi:two-component system, sensor histidine kinase LadS
LQNITSLFKRIMKRFFLLTPLEFEEGYKSEEDCINLLAKLKWTDGFRCRRCGHTHFCEGYSPGARRCTKCKTEETLKSNTIFQHCKLPLRTSMQIMLFAYHNPLATTSEMCRQLGVRQMTCWRMKQIVKEMKF